MQCSLFVSASAARRTTTISKDCSAGEMASAVWRTLRVLTAVIVFMTSAASPSDCPMKAEKNDYDRTCFAPPSAPSVGSRLFEMSISFSSDVQPVEYDFLAFPNGTCGIDLYVVLKHQFLSAAFRSEIEEQASIGIKTYCVYSAAAEAAANTSVPQPAEWRVVAVLSVGGNQQPFASDAELIRVPPEWIPHGIVILGHTDHAIPGQQFLRCNIPFFFSEQYSKYNMNVSLQTNGCPFGKYGSWCDQSCSCATGVECHSFNGVCMCPAGLKGTHCNQSDPQLTVLEQHVFVPYGGTHNLTCSACGIETPSNWSWTKDGQATPLVTTLTTRATPFSPRPFVITSFIEANDTSFSGSYLCEVFDEDGHSYRQRSSLTVTAVPDPFLRIPKNYTALAGSNVTFTCVPKPQAGTIRWVKGRNLPPSAAAAIQNETGRYEVHPSSDGGSELHIYGVEFEDEAVYRCYVGFLFTAPDVQFAEGELTVLSLPRPECTFHSVINAQSGSSLTLVCRVNRARPVPTLTWNFDELASKPKTATYTVLSDDKRSWNINTTMTYEPIPEDDGKKVSIMVENAAQTRAKSVTARLNITYVPIVTINPDPVSLIKDQDVIITCSAEANPKPTSYTWTLKPPIKPSANGSSGNETQYVIRSVGMEYDNASLTCTVENSVGKVDTTVRIKVTDPSISVGVKIAFSISGGLFLFVLVVASVFVHRYRKQITLWWAKRAGKSKENKLYDVFISYRSCGRDEDFVIKELLPRLERDGYRVCVHYKHSLPGKSIIDNISDAVHQSRKTLLLLSPSFIESEWCRYEFQAALSQMLHLHSDLIPVIFEDLGPPTHLSSDLQTILQTLSYITWPGTDCLTSNGRYATPEDRERFWRLLWQSLPKTSLGREVEFLMDDTEMEMEQPRPAESWSSGFDEDTADLL